MNTLKLLTALLIFLLIILSIVTICMVINNKRIIKESFFGSDQQCPPNSARLSASKSYQTYLKGFCSTDIDNLGSEPEGEESQSSENKSPYKCAPNYYRMKGRESYNTESNAWCRLASN